ncbi:hypothetical protein HYT23_05740 [Candidatus Pacearchaeota archaeon]|nr:hypothetical protein [Candidatus Pacearchaeota archaeon]
MKRGILFLLVFLVFVIGGTLFLKVNEDKKEITGETTSQSISINITVSGSPPILELINPKNHTYLTRQDLKFNFTATNADYIWYKLDNSSNASINSPANINLTLGSHKLRLFANNSYGEVEKNVTFYINFSFFIIKDDHYEEGDDYDEDHGNMSRNDKKGESTDFLDYSYEELQNLSNLVLHDPSYAKIKFNEIINITDDLNPADNSLDLNSYTNISFNRIYINSTALPNFNKQATLSLYNLTFTNPRILKDGSVCSACTQQGYFGGTLVFNVTGFSVYSAEETPSSSRTTGQATSDESGGAGAPPENFMIDKEKISISLKQSEVKTEKVKITNNNKISLKLSLDSNLNEMLNISEKYITINKKESKEITLTFKAKEDTIPNIYIGKIMLTSEKAQKELPISIEVESKEALFDVKIEIPTQYKYVLPGEELIAKVEMFNLGGTKKLDVEVEYIIKDKGGIDILRETDTIGVETTASILKTFQIPPNINLGDYILYVRATYNNQVASASEWFIIGKKPSNQFSIIIIIIIIMVLVGIILEMRKIKKAHKQHIDEMELIKRGYIRKK